MAIYVASIPAAAFYDDYEDVSMAPSTFTAAGLPTNYPVLPNTSIPVRGRRLTKGVQSSSYAVFSASPDVTAVTTFVVTVWLGLEPNPKNVDLVNHAVRLSCNLGILTSGTSLFDDTALVGTAGASTATMGSVVGSVASVTCSVTSTSITANTLGLLKVTRLSTDPLDTNLGSVVLLGASITSS